MRDVVGRPGTKVSLCLRVGQWMFAAATISMIIFAQKTTVCNTIAFCCLTFVMGIQFIWSFFMSCVDAYALWLGKDLRTRHNFTIILFADVVVFHLSLAVTSSAAAVVFFYIDSSELGLYHAEHGPFRLRMYFIKLAFISNLLSGSSAYIVAFNWVSIITDL